MNVCVKCGFENNANVKNCTNCVTDLHWAKVNLGKFDGNTDDTRRIGIESRKARGLLAPEDESKLLEPIHLLDTDPIRSTIGRKNIGLSILTGIGHAIVCFFAGATLSASLIFMFMITSGYFSTHWRAHSHYCWYPWWNKDLQWWCVGISTEYPFTSLADSSDKCCRDKPAQQSVQYDKIVVYASLAHPGPTRSGQDLWSSCNPTNLSHSPFQLGDIASKLNMSSLVKCFDLFYVRIGCKELKRDR